MIGKSGRADTPTDPAPLDMVETFVNFRPKELWPKRALKFDDAARQTRAVLAKLEEKGYVQPPAAGDRDDLVNDAAMSAIGRFDETMRALAVERTRGFRKRPRPGPDPVRRGGDDPPHTRHREISNGRKASTRARKSMRWRKSLHGEWVVAGEEPGPGGRDQAHAGGRAAPGGSRES